MKLILPAQISMPSFHKDGSVVLKFESRELTAEEIFAITQMRHNEGWLCFAPNENELEIPETNAEVDTKSPSERLRNVMFVWYKQEVKDGRFVGLFETFRAEKMEKIIEGVKSKLND